MTKCKSCGREIIERDFNEGYEYCVDCIMDKSLSYVSQSMTQVCGIVLVAIGFHITLLMVIQWIFYVIYDYPDAIFYGIPILIICSAFGGLLVFLIVRYKRKSQLTLSNEIVGHAS